MRQPSRRAVLRGSGALLVGTTGCLGRPGQRTDGTPPHTGESTGRAEPAPLGIEQTVGGVTVTLSNLSVEDSALTLDDDTMSLHTADDERYVLVSVVGSDSGPAPNAFSLVVDGETFPARPEVFGPYAELDERGSVYDPDYGTEQGWVGFVVPPALDASEATIVLSYGERTASWRLDSTHLDALRRPRAVFELRDVDLPAHVEPYAPVSVRVAAENVSDTRGTFRGVLNVANLVAAYAPYPFALDADPGETVAWEQTFSEGPSERVSSVGFFLETVAGGREVRATVSSGDQTARETTTRTATETTTRKQTRTATDS